MRGQTANEAGLPSIRLRPQTEQGRILTVSKDTIPKTDTRKNMGATDCNGQGYRRDGKVLKTIARQPAREDPTQLFLVFETDITKDEKAATIGACVQYQEAWP